MSEQRTPAGPSAERTPDGREGSRRERALRSALTRYRVMAYVVGVWLILLVLVAMPLKYLADSPTMVEIVGPVHGFLYMAYLVTAVDLAFRARWSAVRTVLVMLAGTVPFVSFVAERRVSRELGVSRATGATA